MPLSNNEFTYIYNRTAKKLYNMLAGIFKSTDEAVNILNETFTAIASSDKADESTVYKTAAALSLKRLSIPTPNYYDKNVLESFFTSCEQFNTFVSPEAAEASDALLEYFEPVDSFYLLVLYLRMYCELSIDDIAHIIGASKNTTMYLLVDSYRSFMTTAAATVKEDPLLNQFPLLQLFHIALLSQREAVFNDNTYNDFFDYTLERLLSGEPEEPEETPEQTENLVFLDAEAAEAAEELQAEEEAAEEPQEEEEAAEEPQEEDEATEEPQEEDETAEEPQKEDEATEEPQEEDEATEEPQEEDATAEEPQEEDEAVEEPQEEEEATEKPQEEDEAVEEPQEEEEATEKPQAEEEATEESQEEEVTAEEPQEEEEATEEPQEEEVTAEESQEEEKAVEELQEDDNLWEDEEAEELLDDDDEDDDDDSLMEDICSDNEESDSTISTPPVKPVSAKATQPKFSLNDSPEWSRLKSIFRFSVSDENNMKLSRAFELILDGQFAPAQALLTNIKKDCDNASVFLGLLMIDVRARSIDELLFVRTNFREMQNFIDTDNRADVELKDFLERIAKKADAAMAAAPAPEAAEKSAKKEKKSSGGTVAIIVIGIILVIAAIAAVLFFGKDRLLQLLPTQETTVTTTEAPALPVMTKTASYKVRINGDQATQIEFRPLQSGYYGFRSKENTANVAIKILDKNGNVIDEDHNSVGETEFLALAQCESNASIIISIYAEKAVAAPEQVSFTVYSLSDAEAQATKKYREFARNGVTLTADDKLHIVHDKTSPAYRYPTGAKAMPVDFYIDQADNTLWLAFKAKVAGSSATLWYPTELSKPEEQTTAEQKPSTTKKHSTTKKAETTKKPATSTPAKPQTTAQ